MMGSREEEQRIAGLCKEGGNNDGAEGDIDGAPTPHEGTPRRFASRRSASMMSRIGAMVIIAITWASHHCPEDDGIFLERTARSWRR